MVGGIGLLGFCWILGQGTFSVAPDRLAQLFLRNAACRLGFIEPNESRP